MSMIIKILFIAGSFIVLSFVIYKKKLDDKLLAVMEPFFRKMTKQA